MFLTMMKARRLKENPQGLNMRSALYSTDWSCKGSQVGTVTFLKLQDLIRGSLRTAIAMKKHCDAEMEDSEC
jgi:hypothetical protein